MSADNPLSTYFRTPKIYTALPSEGKLYNTEIVDFNSDTQEVPVFAMTARDEMVMKNPDALLNGDAITQVIQSCVPSVKKPQELIGVDVDTLLIAIQGATYGDEVTVETSCPECGNAVVGAASIDSCIQDMTFLPDDIGFTTDNGLVVQLRPVTYKTTVKAGVSGFQNTRSLQVIADIEDELEQLKAFNETYIRMSALNFEILVDSIQSVSGAGPDGETFVVQDRKNIREFMENCDSTVGKQITDQVEKISTVGVKKNVKLQCEDCEHIFETDIGFDPVNFSIAS